MSYKQSSPLVFLALFFWGLPLVLFGSQPFRTFGFSHSFKQALFLTLKHAFRSSFFVYLFGRNCSFGIGSTAQETSCTLRYLGLP
jgi:hypothetical protein